MEMNGKYKEICLMFLKLFFFIQILCFLVMNAERHVI